MIELIKERLKETKEVREFRKSMTTKYSDLYLIKTYSELPRPKGRGF